MKRLVIVGAMTFLAVAGIGRAEPVLRGKPAEFQRIESRLFEAARYDGATRTLTIVFSSGSAYAYSDVPREVYLDFMRIVNKGEYFSRHIRSRYPCERIDHYPSTWAIRD